jgi:ribosomal-protein-alanine N-acetyltransferase
MFRLRSGRPGGASRKSKGANDQAEPAVEIVPMRRSHLKSVIAIERRIFPSPWSLGLYLSEITQPTTSGMMVVVGEAHVTNIGVAPEWQRHGVARRLLLQLAREARQRSAQHLTLEVRVSNVGAQALYHEFGFVPAGVRKNYYSEVHEDALVMWAHDIHTDDYRLRLEGIEARLRPLGPPHGAGQAPAAPEK